MKKTRNGMRITGLLLTMGMLVSLLGVVGLTASAAGGAIDLSSLTETYVISDSGEYIFTGSGSYGIKVESGNPRIVLNNASIMVGEGSAIDVASGSNATIFVLGDNTIGTTKTESCDAPCGGIFVAEGGTVNITSNGTDNILRAHGTLAAAIGGKYDYDNNESYNAGSINISNVTVYAYTNNFYASAIGAAGEGTCGTINITNAVVYVYGAGDEWTSAPGIGNAWSLLDWSDTIPIVIISDSEVHTFRYNPYSDYIGYLGDESGDTYATGSINCGDGGSVKNSTIYCYTGLDATTTDKVVKYGALGGLLKEDGTCEGEHSFTGIICDNCGYCSCTHEDNTNGFCNGCGAYQPATLHEDGYYEISNAGQLLWYGNNADGKSAILTDDIYIGTKENPWNEWTSIVINGGMVFDGNGHTVHMYFTYDSVGGESTSRAVGLFNGTDGAIIKNLIVKGEINCNSSYRVGAVSHSGYGVTFENIVSYVNITNAGLAPTGGIVGQFGRNTGASKMINCAVYADISGTGEVGGLVGKGWGGTQYYIIENCVYVGNVRGSEITVGALVGRSATSTNGSDVKIINTYYCTASDVPAVGSSSNSIGTNEARKMSASQFANGEVAYLLGSAWGQELGTDTYPVLGGTPVGETFKMYGQQLNVGGDLSMKYYVTAFGDGVSADTLKMNFIFLGRETVVSGIYNAEMGMYVFTLEGVSPQCMGDKIDAYLLLNGEEKASKLSYTVEENLLALRKEYEEDEALVTLVNDILAYGTAASEYKDHNSMTDVYVGSDREIRETEWPALDNGFEGYTVVFGQVNYLKIKVNLAEGQTLYLDGVNVTAKVVDGIFKTDGIAPTNFDKKFNFEIRTDGVLFNAFSVSVDDYLSAKRESETMGKLVKALYNYGVSAKEYAIPSLDLSQYENGSVVDITENVLIVGDGNEYNVSLNIAENVTVTFDAGTSGVKLTAPITVADGKTLTLIIAGDAEHTVNGGISLGNASNVIIEGDLTKENNKLTVTGTNGNAGIGANNGVTAGDITIRNARVDATGSSREAPELSTSASISGAAIGTSDGSMGDILIENSIIVAEGGYYESTSHAAAIGIGYVGSTMGNITLKDSQITARNNGDGLASVIGAGANMHVDVTGTLGDIVITNTELNLSMEIGTTHCYAALIGLGVGKSYAYVNMGKIIFTDMKQEELDKVIPTWLPSDFNQYGAYALGRGYDGSAYKKETFGGVWVSDGNGDTVQIGNESGYYCLNEAKQ